jgi:hypothetical protein
VSPLPPPRQPRQDKTGTSINHDEPFHWPRWPGPGSHSLVGSSSFCVGQQASRLNSPPQSPSRRRYHEQPVGAGFTHAVQALVNVLCPGWESSLPSGPLSTPLPRVHTLVTPIPSHRVQRIEQSRGTA